MGTRPCEKHNCNDCVEEGCRNDRINSEVMIHCDNLMIRQDFCVDAIVGVAPPSDEVTVQQLIQNTIFRYAPGSGFAPTDPIRLMTVVARNRSNNFVDVAIQRTVQSDSIPPTLVDATVSPNSEVSLSAPNANRLVASASAPSRVRFFITVFLPNDPILPPNPI